MKPWPDREPASDGQAPGSGSAARHAGQTARALAAGLRLQAGIAIALALVLYVAAGPIAAYSALCGGFAILVPGLVFTLFLARRIGSDSAAFLRTAALAEFGKLFLTGALCAAVFVWVRPLAAGAFFGGMIAALTAGWIGLGRALR